VKSGRLGRTPGERIALLFCTGLLGCLLVREVWWLLCGTLNVDEFENLQVIWLWERGVLPFRDYRHSHLPVYNLLLYPAYAWFGPGVQLPGLVRLFLSPLVFLTLWMVGHLGTLLTRKRLGGILAVLLLLSSPTVAASLVEMRPDVFALPLTLGSLILLLEYLKRRKDGGPLLYAPAILLGFALPFSLKGILVIPLVIGFLEHYHFRVLGLPFSARLKRTLAFCTLVCFPYLAAMALLVAGDLLGARDLSILTTSGMRVSVTPLTQAYKQNLWKAFLLANAVTIVWSGLGVWRSRRRRGTGLNAGGLFFAAAAGILALQLAAQPVLMPHFLVFPFLCVSLLAAREIVRNGPLNMVFWSVLALFTSQVLDLIPSRGSRSLQTEAFRTVLAHTNEDTPVLDGISGFGTFRPILGDHLYYRPGFYRDDFYFDKHQVVAKGLKERTIGAVVDDPFIRASSGRILGLIAENYSVSENPLILLPRKGLPTGPEPREPAPRSDGG